MWGGPVLCLSIIPGHGVLFNRDTAFVNATMLDSTHWPKNAPVVMDVKKRIEKNEEEEPAMGTQ